MCSRNTLHQVLFVSMSNWWADEVEGASAEFFQNLVRPPGRYPQAVREAQEKRLLRQLISFPYREAVVSVHRSANGAKHGRRSLRELEPWKSAADITIHQKKLGHGYAAVVAKYVPKKGTAQ